MIKNKKKTKNLSKHETQLVKEIKKTTIILHQVTKIAVLSSNHNQIMWF